MTMNMDAEDGCCCWMVEAARSSTGQDEELQDVDSTSVDEKDRLVEDILLDDDRLV
jgi:hypothetical protein